MLSKEDNALMCEVEGNTPMHNTIKRYWLPVLPSAGVRVDGDPVRITVLGQHYVVFRDTKGRVGVINERCAHRGASMMLGRVEDCGIRCIYHGWKFDVNGTVEDMPTVKGDSLKGRYRQPAYPTREAGNVIWAYFGPADKLPPFPKFPVFDLPADQVVVQEFFVDANFVQFMEGLVDTSHVGFLHRDAITRRMASADASGNQDAVYRQFAQDLSPELDCEETDFGFRYAALRKLKTDDGIFDVARVTAFALPFVNFPPTNATMLAGLPVANGQTQMFEWNWDWHTPLSEERRQKMLTHHSISDEILDRLGISRRTYGRADRPNAVNGYMQDREAMHRGETYTGMYNFQPEDVAMSNSQGAISDRTTECLVPSDQAVVRMRRLLIESARSVRDGGDPIGVDAETVPRGVQGQVPEGSPWQALFDDAANFTRDYGQFSADLNVGKATG